MSKHSLPVLQEPASSLRADGSRNAVEPADVAGHFTTRRRVVFAALIVLYVALPFIKFGGKPAVFLDIAHRRFHLFGLSLNANDAWLLFFLVTGIGFALILLTTLYGRVWCGYACPQTVFLEGVFRRIERLIEGPRSERLKRNAGPTTAATLARKALKHGIFLALCFGLAHVFLSYFVSLPSLATMVRESPARHPEAFGWVVAFTVVTFLDFAWFREQLCLVICPYGRLQSAMTDRDTVVIGYDVARGEPRGPKGRTGTGDCVDCNRCVQVCPTGIDIRNGLQLDCIGCANCVDACDEVMTKVGKPTGLVRYDSENGFAGRVRRVLRPRVVFYAVLGAVGLTVATFAVRSRVAFEAHILRNGGTVFVTDATHVTNPVRFHFVNKGDESVTIRVTDASDGAIEELPSFDEVRLGPAESRYVNVLLRVPHAEMRRGLRARYRFELVGDERERMEVMLPFLGPVGERP